MSPVRAQQQQDVTGTKKNSRGGDEKKQRIRPSTSYDPPPPQPAARAPSVTSLASAASAIFGGSGASMDGMVISTPKGDVVLPVPGGYARQRVNRFLWLRLVIVFGIGFAAGFVVRDNPRIYPELLSYKDLALNRTGLFSPIVQPMAQEEQRPVASPGSSNWHLTLGWLARTL